MPDMVALNGSATDNSVFKACLSFKVVNIEFNPLTVYVEFADRKFLEQKEN